MHEYIYLVNIYLYYYPCMYVNKWKKNVWMNKYINEWMRHDSIDIKIVVEVGI